MFVPVIAGMVIWGCALESVSGQYKRPKTSKRKLPAAKTTKTTKKPTATPKGKTAKKSAPPTFGTQLKSMQLDSPPLIPFAQFQMLATKLKKARYGTPFRNGTAGDSLIADWALWRAAQLTMKSERDNLKQRRAEIMRDIRGLGSAVVGNRNAVRAFRKKICKALTGQLRKLLDDNFVVRVNAMLILSQMNLMEADLDFSNPQPPESYGPAARVLLEEVIKKGQHPALKILAVRGIKRIAFLGELSLLDREEIANTLIKEFNDKKSHPWYQGRIAEALGSLDLQATSDGKAVIVHTLTQAVNDKTRTFPVRTDAAMALGRAGMIPNVNRNLLMYEIVDLTRQMADQYNADVGAAEAAKDPKLVPAYWPGCFLDIFFAFQPLNRIEERVLARRLIPGDRKAGLLNRFRGDGTVESAYKSMKPIISMVLDHKQGEMPKMIPKDAIDGLASWMRTNRPTGFSVQPGMKAIRVMKAAARPGGKAPINAVATP